MPQYIYAPREDKMDTIMKLIQDGLNALGVGIQALTGEKQCAPVVQQPFSSAPVPIANFSTQTNTCGTVLQKEDITLAEIANAKYIDKLIELKNENDNINSRAIKENETTEMAPIYENISVRARNKSGLLEHRFTYERQQRSVYGYSKKECWSSREKIIADIIKGIKINKRAQKVQYTVYEWLSLFYKTNKIKRDGTKINPDNERNIEGVFKRWWENKSLKTVSGLEIKEKLIEYNSKSNTQRKLFVFLNEALENAVDNQIIKFNPCRAVKLERHVPEAYPVLQPQDQIKILEAIKESPKHEVFFWYLCVTGLRLDAAVKSIDGIDLKHSVVNVLKKSSSTKKNALQIPLLPNFFNEQKLALLKTVTVASADNYFKKLFNKIGIKAVIHSCRKTFASCCYAVGFKDKQIQKWLAHTTIAMTMDTYVDILDGQSPIINYLKALKIHLGL